MLSALLVATIGSTFALSSRDQCPRPPASAVPHLDAYLREGRPHLLREGRDEGRLFVSERGRPLDGNAVLRIVWTVTARVGLRTHPHAFRRSTATGLVKNGASVVAVATSGSTRRRDTWRPRSTTCGARSSSSTRVAQRAAGRDPLRVRGYP